MKNVLILAAMLGLATVANASSHYAQYPVINEVSADNLCDAGASFQTIHPVEVCTQWVDGAKAANPEGYQGNELVCASKSTQSLAVSKHYTVSTCLDRAPANPEGNLSADCQNSRVEERTVGNQISVPVVQNRNEAGLVQVGTMTYTIPACK